MSHGQRPYDEAFAELQQELTEHENRPAPTTTAAPEPPPMPVELQSADELAAETADPDAQLLGQLRAEAGIPAPKPKDPLRQRVNAVNPGVAGKPQPGRPGAKPGQQRDLPAAGSLRNAKAPWQELLLPDLGLPVGFRQIAEFYRTLGMMMKTGMPLDLSLPLAGNVGGPRYRYRARRWAAGCTSGRTLWSQMAEDHEPMLRVALIRAGEFTGRMPEMCGRIVDHVEHLRALRNLAISRSIYPLTMLHALMLFGALMGNLSGSLSGWAFLYIPSLFWAMVWTVVFVLWLLRRTGINAHLMLLPGLAQLTRPFVESNACMILNASLAAGMKMRESLELAGGACGNAIFAARLRLQGEGIERGTVPTLTMALHNAGFTSQVIAQVETGERSGSLEATLDRCATDCREQFQTRTMWTLRVTMGLLYGTVVLLMALAIINAYGGYLNMVSSTAAGM